MYDKQARYFVPNPAPAHLSQILRSKRIGSGGTGRFLLSLVLGAMFATAVQAVDCSTEDQGSTAVCPGQGCQICTCTLRIQSVCVEAECQARPFGTSCTDGNACTLSDHCSGGFFAKEHRRTAMTAIRVRRIVAAAGTV
jgi:hypothetical protein